MVTDLDTLIREWFAVRLETMPCDEDLPVHDSLQMAAHAVFAVLDRHKPMASNMSSETLCAECTPGEDHYLGRSDPCPTKIDIARALGIEVSCG